MADYERHKALLRKNRVTRDDVARHAQVSSAVVSYVINNGPRAVAPETRQRVEQAIAELGYFPNTIARSLRADQSYTVGLIVPSLADPACAELVADFQATCSQAGYLVVLFNTERDARREQQAVAALRNHQVDALAVMLTQDSAALLRPLLFAGVPVVVLDRHLPNVHTITTDDLEGGRLGTRHLLGLGHRHIGLLLPDVERTAGAERLLGYCQALASAAIAYDEALVATCGVDPLSAYQAMRQLLNLPQPPSAVFADSDLIALGALRAIHEAGLQVPDDCSLLGYGTSALVADFVPPLTTVQTRTHRLGHFAADIVLRLASQRDNASASAAILPVELVIRASTSPWCGQPFRKR